MLSDVAILDDLLGAHRQALGKDYLRYRNHTYRVLNLCAALSQPNAAQLEKIAVVSAFHDLGIWTAKTFDYLPPSRDLARHHLEAAGNAESVPEVDAMILEHHKLRAYTEQPTWLVEPFRKADWIDVTMRTLSFGLPRTLLREIAAAFPDAGFHGRLVQLALKRTLMRPWSPLPMMRW